MNIWRRAPISTSLVLFVCVPFALITLAALLDGWSPIPRVAWLRWTHSGYSRFIERGGSLSPTILEAVSQDPDRDRMARRRTLAELKRLYPFLVEDAVFPAGGYKRSYRPDADHVLWFHPDDGMDWCIFVFDGDPVFNRLELVKG